MSRPVTLFTGQWADLPLVKLAKKAESWGYDGLELACWGDHFNSEEAAGVTLKQFMEYTEGKPENFAGAVRHFAGLVNIKADVYCDGQWRILISNGLTAYSLSSHLVGQAVCDKIDMRHKAILPPNVWGDGIGADIGEVGYNAEEAENIRKRAAMMMVITGIAARRFMNRKKNQDDWGVKTAVVNGFTGSKIWHSLYPFPPTDNDSYWNNGYEYFGQRFKPILDAYDAINVNFGLEVHPTEVGHDIASAQRAVEAVKGHKRFGFNYDPSHMAYQGVDYVKFIRTFGSMIFHVHMKDVWWGHGDGTVGVFGGHTEFGDPRRYWDFRSIGHGDINFKHIIVALNDVGYQGPLSVEWEDIRMNREHGAEEACELIKKVDFKPSEKAFDKAFAN